MVNVVDVLAIAMDAELDEHGYEDDDEKRGQVAHHFAAHQLNTLRAAGYAVVALPLRTQPPPHWDSSCLGAWATGANEEPVSAWPVNLHGSIAMPNGDFLRVEHARGLALALLAAVKAAS